MVALPPAVFALALLAAAWQVLPAAAAAAAGAAPSSGGDGGAFGQWRLQPHLHDKVTLPACASACHGLSYAVAGIDGGNHCWCGNASDLSSAGAKARARPAGECQVSSCHADPSEKCGGAGRLLAYGFVCDGPAPAPPAPPTERGIGLQHELFVPFGDDPVVLSTVNVANSAQKSRNVSVITVWCRRLLMRTDT